MPRSPCYRPVHIKPVTGPMDVRSTPDEVPFGGWRWVLNAEVTTKYRMCRMRGFRKLQDKEEDYNNEDLHDQNVSAEADSPLSYVRQPIQFLHQAETPSGFSKLFAGTQNRLYAKSNSSGNWQVLSDQLGGAGGSDCQEEVRWTLGVVGQIAVISNSRDQPVYNVLDQGIEDDNQAVKTVPDLIELNLSRAGIVISWNGIIVMFNITIDGERLGDGIMWSDYERPLSYVPDLGVSLAGRKNLGAGETILGVAPLKDAMMIYTTKSIWEMRVAGSEEVFTFSRRYADNTGSRCLAYPRTLVSDGENNYYFARDGVYQYSFYLPQPKLIDWIHRASAVIFDDIDQAACNIHSGAYHADRKQIWWSWTKVGQACPEQTLIINTEFPFSSYMDHGFTAFVNHAPDYNKSLRDWVLEKCICTPETLDLYGGGLQRGEGGYCYDRPAQEECDVTPANFTSGEARDEGDGIIVEDWVAEPDEDSLVAILASLSAVDECSSEWSSDECNADNLFIMASSADWCIKEYADVYYREKCVGFTGCGAYSRLGYRTLLRSGPMDLKLPDDDKNVSRFAIEAYPAVQTIPSQVKLRIGVSAQALDPNETNTGRQVILWEEQDLKELEFMSEVDEATHRRDNTRPITEMEWGLYLDTRFIYFEIEVINAKVTPQDTGGAVCFSRFTFDAAAKMRCP